MSCYIELKHLCNKDTSSVMQKDLEGIEGEYPIFGASGYIKNIDYYHQEREYIAVVKDGAGVGRVYLLPEKSSVIGTLQYIIPNEDVDIKYLYYALTYANLSKYYTGATIPHIYFKDYCREKICCPDLNQQRVVAQTLGYIDSILEKRKSQLVKLGELLQSQFIEMFGDPVRNTMRWNVKCVSEVAPIEQYRGKHEKRVWLLNLDMVESHTGEIKEYIYVDVEEVGSSVCSFDEGNVLYSKLRPYLNKVVIPERKGYGTSEWVTFRPKSSCLNRVFFAYLIRDRGFVLWIREKVFGAKMPRVSMKDFMKFKCILPPIELQNKFADFVRQVDKSQFIEMFGDPIENEKGWRTIPLLETGKFKNGMNYSSKDSGVEMHCLGVADFQDNAVIDDMSVLPMVSLKDSPNADYLLQDGDIVFVRSNGNKALVGRSVVVYPGDEPVVYSGFCIRYRKESEELLTDYLLRFFKTDLVRAKIAGRGANIQNLNQKILAALNVPIPSIELQKEFSIFVRQVDKSKYRVYNSRKIINNLIEGIIHLQ